MGTEGGATKKWSRRHGGFLSYRDMREGRVRLTSGFSMKCLYEVDSDGVGRLELSSALYHSLGQNEEMTLILADGSEQMIRIQKGGTVGAATFRVLGRV